MSADGREAWAIEVRPGLFLGVGWFDWKLDRPGLPTMTFATRREAREALKRSVIRAAYPRARVARVAVCVCPLDFHRAAK